MVTRLASGMNRSSTMRPQQIESCRAVRVDRAASHPPTVTRWSDPVYMQAYSSTPLFTALPSILLTPYCEQTHQSDGLSPSLPSQSWSSLCHPSDCGSHLGLINRWCCCTKVNGNSLTLKIQLSIMAHTKYYVNVEIFFMIYLLFLLAQDGSND